LKKAISYLEEGCWAYYYCAQERKYVLGRIEKRGEEPFSSKNADIYIPGFGKTWLDPKFVIYVFPKVNFRPIQILIGELKTDEGG